MENPVVGSEYWVQLPVGDAESTGSTPPDGASPSPDGASVVVVVSEAAGGGTDVVVATVGVVPWGRASRKTMRPSSATITTPLTSHGVRLPDLVPWLADSAIRGSNVEVGTTGTAGPDRASGLMPAGAATEVVTGAVGIEEPQAVHVVLPAAFIVSQAAHRHPGPDADPTRPSSWSPRRRDAPHAGQAGSFGPET